MTSVVIIDASKFSKMFMHVILFFFIAAKTCNVKNICNALKGLSPREYTDLGLGMGLTMAKIQGIEMNNPGQIDRQLKEIIQIWIAQKSVSWKSLADILDEMDQHTLASDIRKN